MALKSDDTDIFSLIDNSGKVILIINKDMELAIEDGVSKESLMVQWFTELANWGKIPESKGIEAKTALILCYTALKSFWETNAKRATQEQAEQIQTALESAGKLFYN